MSDFKVKFNERSNIARSALKDVKEFKIKRTCYIVKGDIDDSPVFKAIKRVKAYDGEWLKDVIFSYYEIWTAIKEENFKVVEKNIDPEEFAKKIESLYAQISIEAN